MMTPKTNGCARTATDRMRLAYPAIESANSGYFIAVHVQTWPLTATKQASVLANDWFIFAGSGLAVALLVWGLIGFALARWRRRSRPSNDPPQFRNNYPLEIAWTAVPFAFVCILFFYGYRAEASVDAVDPHPDVIVHVNAYRWGWQFRYEGGPLVAGATHSPIIGSNDAPPPELVLPLNETTRIDLTSSDVTHSFWVPDFLFKRDAIPGQVSSFDLSPDRLGSFPGRCAQFCGLDHAFMTFLVRVVTPAQFAAWRRTADAR